MLMRGLRSFCTQRVARWVIIDDEGVRHMCEGSYGECMLDASIASGFQFEKACGGNAECLTCHIEAPADMAKHAEYDPPSQKEEEGLMFAINRE